ncbi:hypothetical protein IEQ34_017309 [Dendrobium chrysotoxum]|uniref:Uncharacterized protein n=1 Tax=Dendrobium chrysotoxum TaxID=161865 RepID=A0AAV7FTJ4_DENCH|nr:hypothetical protein IEQ34_017309 [Dendrobium chrysotoxum]
MKDLSIHLHVGTKDIMKMLNVSDVEHLLYEIRCLKKYIEEEFLFKIGLPVQAGRSNAMMLKKLTKVQEPHAPVSKVLLLSDRQRVMILKLYPRKKIATHQVTSLTTSDTLVIQYILWNMQLGRERVGGNLLVLTEVPSNFFLLDTA